MILLVLLPILFGLFFYIWHNNLLLNLSMVIETVLFAMSLYFLNLHLISDAPITQFLSGTAPPFGMALRIDSLSAMMLVLNNVLFALMVLFNLHKPYMNKLFIFLFLSLQGLINGIFLSTDFFNIYILIEVATVVVSVLIMYKKDSQSMYDGMIYLLVNMIAMTFFLLGIGYLYKLAGALDFNSIHNYVNSHSNVKLLILPFALLLTGVSLKAALMPLFSWLPKAHGTASAPSIVSGVLSGIFVKTGVYLYLRLLWVFGASFPVAPLFVWMGFITAIVGFIFALAQSDIKLILAYHTISQVGLIMIGISSSSIDSFHGGIYHIFAHGIFKTLLFLIAGLLIELFKTRQISEMHGLYRRSKFLSAVLIIAVLSITGAPLLSGGYSKYYIASGFKGLGMEILFIIINLGTMMSFIKFLKILLPEKQETHLYVPYTRLEISELKHVLPLNTAFSLLLLSVICIVLGIGGDTMFGFLIGEHGHLSWIQQLYKLPKYLLTYAAALGIFHILNYKPHLLSFFKGLELSFNQITLAILTFFVVTTFYLHLIV